MSRRRTAVFTNGLLLLTALTACREPAAPAGKINQPVTLAVLSGGDQSALEYTELPQPVVVQLLNAKGKPVSGQLVNFRVVQGGGSVYAGAAFTDAQGIAREWWTIGSALVRNLLEARAVDPSTGAQLVLGTVLANPQPLENPIIQFKCGNQADWVAPPTGPLPGECYGPSGDFVTAYPRGAVIAIQVRVVHGANSTPVPRMWLDFFAHHNAGPETAPRVTPLYGKTDASGIVSNLSFTMGTARVGNDLLVIGPLDFFSRLPVVERVQPFRAD